MKNALLELTKDAARIVKQRAELVRASREDRPIPVVSFFTTNWGDAVGKDIARLLSGRPTFVVDINVLLRTPTIGFGRKLADMQLVSTVGSILHWVPDRSIVWGSGLISPDFEVARDLDIRAVRGPLTRQALIDQGHDCPEVYGDPAIVLADLLDITPSSNPSHKLGCVLTRHYSQETEAEIIRRCDPHMISVRLGLREFLEEIADCEAIMSSSLHGLVAADSVGIPSIRIICGTRLWKGDFKYRDYEASTQDPLVTIDKKEIDSVDDVWRRMPKQARRLDTTPLLQAQPWDDV